MKKGLLLAALSVWLLAGCTSKEYDDTVAYNQKVHEQIAEKTSLKKRDKVTYITKPPVIVKPLTEHYDKVWLDDVITANIPDLPLSLALEQIMIGVKGVPIYFGEHVDPNQRVTLHFSSARSNVLNLLSRETGYGIEYRKGRLEVTKYITRVFSLDIPSGQLSGQLGSQGTTSSEDSTRVEGQYINVQYKDVNITNEVADAIKKLLGGDEEAKESVSASVNTTSITVKATPDEMADIASLVERFQKELAKQVILNIQVIEFRSNLSTERGIDWNVVRDSGDGLLKFFVPGTNTVSQGSAYGLAFEGSGKWSGTQAFIKVLEKQGSVSTQTPITAMVLNNQPARINQLRNEPYLYETSSDNNDGVVTSTVTRATEHEGVDMMITASVQDQDVTLRISGKLQKIENRNTETVDQVTLGMYSTTQAQINFMNRLRYGQTFVIGSVQQTARTAEKAKSFWSLLLGGTGSSDDTVETLVLLTPEKVGG